MVRKISLFVILIYLFSACSVDPIEEPVEIQFANVQNDLWVHFRAFQEEGLARGVVIDLGSEDLSGEISEISEDGVAGTCQYGTRITNHITIDQSFWNRASFLAREYVVFHELGHCFLFRDHDNGQDANGRCSSIMNSGLTSCRNVYTQANRDFYLDELFSEINRMQ